MNWILSKINYYNCKKWFRWIEQSYQNISITIQTNNKLMITNDNYIRSFDTWNFCTKTGFDFIYIIVYLFWVWFKIPATNIPTIKIPKNQNPDRSKSQKNWSTDCPGQYRTVQANTGHLATLVVGWALLLGAMLRTLYVMMIEGYNINKIFQFWCWNTKLTWTSLKCLLQIKTDFAIKNSFATNE